MNLAGWVLLIIALVVIVIVIGYFRKVKPDEADDSASMSTLSRRVLVVYLLVLGLLLIYSLVQVNSAQFPAGNLVSENLTQSPSATPASSPEGTSGTTATSTAPTLDGVFSQPDPNNPSILQITVCGRNFAGSSVRFNRDKAATKPILPSTMLQAPLDEAHSTTGYVAVDVINSDNAVSNSIVVKVGKPTATINLFGWQPRITQELQLLLLALLAGAIGSYVHAIKSLGDFIGNRTLTASWFWWYIIRPFLGMAMALIFYGVLRGGFMAGTPADAKVVNPFGVIAIGALVGMFADKAAQKLAEIFDTLFQSPDQRKDKLSDLAITTANLPKATVGVAYHQPLAASGGTAPYKWSLVDPPAWLKIEPDAGTLLGQPNAAGTINITVKVTDKTGAAVTKVLTLTVDPPNPPGNNPPGNNPPPNNPPPNPADNPPPGQDG